MISDFGSAKTEGQFYSQVVLLFFGALADLFLLSQVDA
jgi:hypothetical protein